MGFYIMRESSSSESVVRFYSALLIADESFHAASGFAKQMDKNDQNYKNSNCVGV